MNDTRKHRSDTKAWMIDFGQDELSGSFLNVSCGLPADAEWRESNFD